MNIKVRNTRTAKLLATFALLATPATQCSTDQGHPLPERGYVGAPTIVCPSSIRIVGVHGSQSGVTFVESGGFSRTWPLPASGSWSGSALTTIGAGGNAFYANGQPVTLERVQPQINGMNPETFNGGVSQVLATGEENALLFSGCHDGAPKQVKVRLYAETWH